MTLLFFEGFENIEPNGRAGFSYIGSAAAFTAGRSSGTAIKGLTSNISLGVSIPVPNRTAPADRIWVASMAFRPDALTSTSLQLMAFRTPVNGGNHVHVLLLNNGQLNVTSQGGSSTSTYQMVVGEWARVELRALILDSGGWAQVWVNGVMVAEILNTDSQNNNDSGQMGNVLLYAGSPNANVRGTIDDVYVLDSTGSAPYNASIGDVRCETIVPNGNGSSSGLVGSDGNSVDNYQLVDELPAASADYVTGALGSKDTYTLSNLTIAAGTVHAVQAHYQASKNDAGSAGLVPIFKLDANEYRDTGLGLGLTPVYGQSSIRTVAPDGAAWTVAKVNAMEIGAEVS